VSDPDHPRYGQYLSKEEINELVKPSDESLDLIQDWLQKNGVQRDQLQYSTARDWIDVSLPVRTVESLLRTEYQVFEHDDGTRLVRSLDWSLPQSLHDHIDTIQPTTSFFRTSPQKKTIVGFDWDVEVPDDYQEPADEQLRSVCNVTSVTPQCFQHLYKTSGYEVQAADENSIGFNNFLGEVPLRPDGELFANKYRPDAIDHVKKFPQISIDGGPTQDGPITQQQLKQNLCQEANLDLQAILGISHPTPIHSYSTGGEPPFIADAATKSNTNEPYLTWVTYALEKDDLPPVISTSYGDDEQTVPYYYAKRVCQEFARLGARGVSLLVSSGDAGVGNDGACFTNDSKKTKTFLPSFPPSCPYVTVIGGTHEFQPEVVAFRPAKLAPNGTELKGAYSSGGGFGNYFPMPAYQAEVVREYIEGLNGEFDGLYNKFGRAYPDISAQAQNFAIFWNGTESTISGTSASSPLMAGIIALVNDARMAAGKPALGFLNPWIYKRGHRGFTDITSGSAVGCDSKGFPASEGWDAVTGFGTPVKKRPKNFLANHMANNGTRSSRNWSDLLEDNWNLAKGVIPPSYIVWFFSFIGEVQL
jgi:tripeptidyl-peptidase-1